MGNEGCKLKRPFPGQGPRETKFGELAAADKRAAVTQKLRCHQPPSMQGCIQAPSLPALQRAAHVDHCESMAHADGSLLCQFAVAWPV